MIGKLSTALSWLGGANLAILRQAPTTRGKFVQMGLVLLTTASLGLVSMTFFMHLEVDEPEATAVVIGIFWGLILLNLDRFLVVSMGATRDRRRLLLMATPRLCLAIVISLVVSTPITLRIFQSDINYQIRASQSSQSSYLSGLEAKSGLAVQAKQLSSQIAGQQAILNGALPHAITNPQLQTAQQQVQQLAPKVATAKQQEVTAWAQWQCELYGDGPHCAGASNRVGNGPIAQAKQETYEQALSNYNTLNGQLQAAQHSEDTAAASLKQAQGAALARYQSAARKALPGLERQYNKIEAEIAQNEAGDQTAVSQHTGTLAQLSALWSASAGNPVLLLAHLTIMALFFFIELLPVLIKVLLNLGPLDLYEKVLKTEEEKVAEGVRRERLKERRAADAAARVQIKVAEDKSDREQTLGIKANKFVAQRMETILDAALQQWSGQVTAMLNNTPVNPGGPGPPGPTTPNGAGVPPTVPGMPATGPAANGTGSPNGAGRTPKHASPAGPTQPNATQPQAPPAAGPMQPQAPPTAGPTQPNATQPQAPPTADPTQPNATQPNLAPPNGFGLPPAGSTL